MPDAEQATYSSGLCWDWYHEEHSEMDTESTYGNQGRDNNMTTQTFKITMNKLYVSTDGDFPGKSEIYYTLMVDDQIIDSLDEHQARKTGDGDTSILGNSATVTKSASASLTVLGNVSDDDGFLKGAHVQLRIDAHGGVLLHDDAPRFEGLEPRKRHIHFISAGGDIRE